MVLAPCTSCPFGVNGRCVDGKTEGHCQQYWQGDGQDGVKNCANCSRVAQWCPHPVANYACWRAGGGVMERNCETCGFYCKGACKPGDCMSWAPPTNPPRGEKPVTGRRLDYTILDDVVGSGTMSPGLFSNVMQWYDEVVGCKMPRREEPDMPSLTTYAYEVLVTEKRDEKGVVVRKAESIGSFDGQMEKPTREGLLLHYADRIAGFKDAQKITNPESEVVVNIRPFCG